MAVHLDELIELYALGALDQAERARVDAHAATCSACTRALGAAEATVAALDDAFGAPADPPHRLTERIAISARTHALMEAPRATPPTARLTPSSFGVAAVLALTVGLGGAAAIEHANATRTAANESAILATIATSHFNHVTFSPIDPRAPVSKVLYARDGAWFYVIIDSATCDCRLIARSVTAERDLGAPIAGATTATLFIRTFSRPTALELRDPAGRPISRAILRYSVR
jgi:hypothetical protein